MMNSSASGKGKVFICGAGPGDPKLMTVKAVELVRSSDVVLYDRLVSKQVIDQIPPGVEKIYVGRTVGDPTGQQHGTNKKMVDYAKIGKKVLRLKGGDPFVFGRGGEEAEYLAKNGIDFEIVPGITSAIASPAYAGIPLTHRRLASSVAFVTGHEGIEKQTRHKQKKGRQGCNEPYVKWNKLAGAVDTIVILMGIENLAQISNDLAHAGLDMNTPVAVIENGTTGTQRIIKGKLLNISNLAAKLHATSPAIIVIGKVVQLQEKLDWFQCKRRSIAEKE